MIVWSTDIVTLWRGKIFVTGLNYTLWVGSEMADEFHPNKVLYDQSDVQERANCVTEQLDVADTTRSWTPSISGGWTSKWPVKLI